MSELQQALAAALGDHAEGVPLFPDRTDAKKMVKEILAEEADRTRKMKLTWTGRGRPAVDETDIVGLWNRRMPHTVTARQWVIQNRMILRSNGTELPKAPAGSDFPYDLSEIPDTENSWPEEIKGRPTGRIFKSESYRKVIRKAYLQHLADAVAKDPLVCPIAADFRGDSQVELMRHEAQVHPAEFAEILGISLNVPAVPAPSPEVETAPLESEPPKISRSKPAA